MTTVAISKTAKPPIQVAQYVRNGKSPDAALQALLAERVGQGALLRTKQVFSRSCPFSLLPSGISESQSRWRFAWHTGPYCKTVAVMMSLAPQNFDVGTDEPCGKLTITDESGTVVAIAKLHGGSTSNPLDDVPDNLTIALISIVDPSDESTPVDLAPETDYYGAFSDEGHGRLQSACVWEVSLPPDTDNGYPASGVAVNSPIYASHRADVATALAKLWHKGGQPLWHWCSDTDDGARVVGGGDDDIHLGTGLATTVSASSPGVQLDLRQRSRLSLTMLGVPVRMAVYASSEDGTGSVRLVDSKTLTMVEVPITSATPAWHVADGFLPALDAKYDLVMGDVVALGKELTCYAVSIYEYSEPSETALLSASVEWEDALVHNGDAATFSIEIESVAADSSGLSVVVEIDDAVTVSEPSTKSNVDGWTIGSWSANPDTGVQWRCTMTKSTLSEGQPSAVSFEVTPSTDGTLGVSVEASNDDIGSASDTASTTVVTPALAGSTSAEPNPAGEDGATVTAHIEVTGNQTGLQFALGWYSPDGLSPLPALTLVDADGWTVELDSGGGFYLCTLASASHGATFDIVFSLGGSSSAGTVQLFVEDFLSDQVVSGTWDPYDVEYEASAPAWTVDATSGMAVPADATEFAAFRAANGLTNWSNPASLYTFQEASGSIEDTIGSLDLSEFGSGHVRDQSVSGWARKFQFMTDGTTGCYRTIDSSLPDISTTSCLMAAWVKMPASAPAEVRNFLVMGGTATARITTTPRIGSASGSNPATGTDDPTGEVMLVFLQVDRTAGVQRVITPHEVITPTLGTVSGKMTCFGSSAAAASTGYGWGARWDGADAELTLSDFHAFYVAVGVTPDWSP